MKRCMNCGYLEVIESQAGFYIGAKSKHVPYCRITGYYHSRAAADFMLRNRLTIKLRDSDEIKAVNDGIIKCEANHD